MPLPPLAEQLVIVNEVDGIVSVISKTNTEIAFNLKRASRLRQSILKRAFEGKLVPQDPADESAELLLQRIREQRVQAKPKHRTSKKKTSKADRDTIDHDA